MMGVYKKNYLKLIKRVIYQIRESQIDQKQEQDDDLLVSEKEKIACPQCQGHKVIYHWDTKNWFCCLKCGEIWPGAGLERLRRKYSIRELLAGE
jgi:hypothetical protein